MTQFIWKGGNSDAGVLSAWLEINLKNQEVAATVLPAAGDIIRMNATGTMTGTVTAAEIFFNSSNTISGTANISLLATIGNSGTGTSTVTVTGASWTDSAPLLVGNAAAGVLTISNAGTVTNNNILIVGRATSGTLDVLSGSTLVTTSTADLLGNVAGSNGIVTIDGAGSIWKETGQLTVGVSGNGLLSVSNGGSFNTGALVVLGDTANSTGTLSVSSGGIAQTANDIIVGGQGAGLLTADSKGEVLIGGTLFVSTGLGTGAGTVDATGGSTISAAFMIDAINDTIDISSGATLATSGTVSTDSTPVLDGISLSGTLNVNAGTLQSGGQLVIGAGSAEAAVSVQAGAAASVWATVIGDTPGFGDSLIITGAGTNYKDAGGPVSGSTATGGTMVVGNAGLTSTLDVTAGATLTEASDASIAAGAGAFVTIDGAGSVWHIEGQGQIGAGASGFLTVSNAASLAADGGLAVGALSAGSLFVESNAKLTSGGDFVVGASGFGTVTIETGGTVDALKNLFVGATSGGRLIALPGSAITAGSELVFGNGGAVGTAQFSGSVLKAKHVTSGVLANTTISTNSTFTIAGTLTSGPSIYLDAMLEGGSMTLDASRLTAGGQVLIGDDTSEARVLIDNGSTASVWATVLGAEPGFGGSLTINGIKNSYTDAGGPVPGNPGSMGGYMVLGAGIAVLSGAGTGSNGTLNVTAGGVLTEAAYAIVGAQTGSTGTVTIDGTGSHWTVGSELNVGGAGEGTLTVSDSATVSALTYLKLADQLTGTIDIMSGGTLATGNGTLSDIVGATLGASGTLNLTDSGSLYTTTNGLIIGAGGSGKVTVTNSATAASDGAVFDGNIGKGSLTLSAGGVFRAGSGIEAGASGGSGSVEIDAGGTLSSTGSSDIVAAGTGSLALITVSGSGALWQSTGALTLGGGGTAVMTVGSGGTISVAGGITAAQAGSSTLDIQSGGSVRDGGALDLGLAGSAQLLIASGGTLTTAGAADAIIGSTLGSAEIALQGAGATWNTSEGISVGDAGAGTLSLAGGASLDIPVAASLGSFNLQIGNQGGSSGLVQIDASTLETGANPLAIGIGGSGTASVTGGGSLDMPSGLEMAVATGSAGTLGVDGSGSVATIAGFATIGGLTSAGGTAMLAATDGGLIESAVSMRMFAGATLSADGTSQIEIGGSGHGQAGAVVIDAGASLSGAGLISAAVDIAGEVSASGGTLDIAGGVTMQSGSQLTAIITGAIDIGGGGAPVAGTMIVEAGHTLSGAGTISAAIENSGQLTASGGTLEVAGALTGNGTVHIAAGSMLLLDNVSGSENIVFDSADASTLKIVATSGAKFSISTEATGDNIEFEQVPAGGGAPVALKTLTDAPGGTHVFKISGTPGHLSVNEVVPCFGTGTRIATKRGEVAVEELQPGDRVRTARKRGKFAKVVWIGHRTVDCRRHPRPHDVMPVRVAPGAFGDGLPVRDLVLSPDHAVFVHGVLIPVRYLINGGSIVQTDVERVTYWHVELAAHDVLLAEGLPCESYLDTGNRAAFANGGGVVQAHPEFARKVWADKACAELVLDGPVLAQAKTLVLARLGGLGHSVTTDPGVQFWADDIEVPAMWFGTACRMMLPEGTQRLVLTSRIARPADLDANSTDTRLLGAGLQRIMVNGAALPLDSPRFLEGWLPAEEGLRWSTARAVLDLRGVRTLEMKFGDWHRYLKQAPAGARRAAA